VDGLAAALGSSKKTGLADAAVEASRNIYGANTFTAVPPKSFFSILYEGFKDPVILLLCAAATVSWDGRGFSGGSRRQAGEPSHAPRILNSPQSAPSSAATNTPPHTHVAHCTSVSAAGVYRDWCRHP
jgi:hypothetical protein